MITETLELKVLHAVVKHGSYAKAAEELMLSPSGVSRIVSRLEERLGARLVQRTTRKLSLTEAGMAFHSRTIHVLEDLADAEAAVQDTVLKPRGNVRLTAPVGFGQHYVAPLMDELLGLFPDLTVDLFLVDRFVDLVEEGIDLALRIGALKDSRFVARRLCTNHRVLVASPEYLEQLGEPQTPKELEQHACIVFSGFSRPCDWRLFSAKHTRSVTVRARMSSNNPLALMEAAGRGLGITFAATCLASTMLVEGKLVRVLPEYELEPTAIYGMYPSARQLSSKVRATLDFLIENLSDPPAWDRELLAKFPGFELIKT